MNILVHITHLLYAVDRVGARRQYALGVWCTAVIVCGVVLPHCRKCPGSTVLQSAVGTTTGRMAGISDAVRCAASGARSPLPFLRFASSIRAEFAAVFALSTCLRNK